jgi:hypothetical protein
MPFRPETAALVALLGLASACDPADSASDDGETMQPIDEGPWETFAERSCPPGSILSFENFGGPYLLDHCKGCHSKAIPASMRQGAPVGIDFDTIADVRDMADRIWARAADQNASMPPVGAPGPEERAALGEWLACGAPLNADLDR